MKIEIKKITEEEKKLLGIELWPVWTKDISEFDWYYDSKEMCYFIEGEVTVKTDNGDYEIKKGDFVTFPQGLKCRWIVKKPVKKYYSFE